MLLATAGPVGCDRNALPAAASAQDRLAGTVVLEDRVSPAEVARRLGSLHRERDYDGIARLIVEDRSETTIDVLRAIDEVLDANGSLHRAVRESYGTATSDTWDLATMENNIGVFSSQVRLINQRFKGSRAVVTLQEGESVPLVHAEFELTGGRWLFRPETVPSTLAPALTELAGILRDVEESVRLGASFESYMDAFLYRVMPQMARSVTAHDGPPQGLADAGDALRSATPAGAE